MDRADLLKAYFNPKVGVPNIRIPTVDYGLTKASSFDDQKSYNHEEYEEVDNIEYAEEYKIREEKMYWEYQKKTEVNNGTCSIQVWS